MRLQHAVKSLFMGKVVAYLWQHVPSRILSAQQFSLPLRHCCFCYLSLITGVSIVIQDVYRIDKIFLCAVEKNVMGIESPTEREIH